MPTLMAAYTLCWDVRRYYHHGNVPCLASTKRAKHAPSCTVLVLSSSHVSLVVIVPVFFGEGHIPFIMNFLLASSSSFGFGTLKTSGHWSHQDVGTTSPEAGLHQRGLIIGLRSNRAHWQAHAQVISRIQRGSVASIWAEAEVPRVHRKRR
jgi:hypothetical protein